ncbi:phosphate ABC transporter substrate-binding protein [Stutzerimonas stutzeri]|uniref:Phosphate ABC transporter substrate-binding protein n=1 Tax=Stutzerimonas stutzeri TaxID=316 RepID=W8R8I7_STUST|nr:sialate O-acetylesterase [Stutzerimonas stutzeri]AHL74652.1 phosphate ABC transporter substrate-binding protein [Stutzerimonas stutzeri]MCQ4329182.1 phosphate ABC transporter substrate-binding protein [Stutzerimonas stutzeri]
MPEPSLTLWRFTYETVTTALLGAVLLCACTSSFASEPSLAIRDAQNKRFSEQVMTQPDRRAPAPTAKYNHVITYGQSLASAAEGWPALSKQPRYDNLMLGNSVRSATYSGARFIAVGEPAFKPLRAVVQLKRDPKVILDGRSVARLDEHAQEEGESVEVGALNMVRRLYLQKHGVEADPEHLFVASNASTSGRSIAQLSKVGGTHEYRRVLQAVDQAKQIADAQGASYSLSAFFWLQGEYDYSQAQGGINDKAHYKKMLRQLRDDLNADTAQAIAGQQQMPAFISYQTDAKSSVVNGSLDIGMAQWELAQEEPNWYLAGPVYPYVDKGTHLSANGYRWFGQMLGKVYHQVVVEGRNWQPLSPRGATFEHREVLVDFHVPFPPLMFDLPYLDHQARAIKNRGFTLIDEQGEVQIKAVEIVADTVVRLNAGRDLVGTPRIRYASQAVGGAGELRDSDPAQADARYEYLPDEGMPREANIAALVDKPYPLHNWSIAFELQAVEGHDSPR